MLNDRAQASLSSLLSATVSEQLLQKQINNSNYEEKKPAVFNLEMICGANTINFSTNLE